MCLSVYLHVNWINKRKPRAYFFLTYDPEEVYLICILIRSSKKQATIKVKYGTRQKYHFHSHVNFTVELDRRKLQREGTTTKMPVPEHLILGI